ncbi:hypothetical protein SDC9_148150 [bioreactor metagenome]|uniref:Uncharacterized protein n=1 Tax=bioreactor metagenome TaxID=1076179 RepID=A0A645EI51_9ZZZZ
MDDTHPVLKERLAALGERRAALPEKWSERGSLDLLGASGPRWMEHFDRHWCKDNADEWKRHHASLQRARARVLELQSRGTSRSVAEQVETAGLIRQLNPESNAATALYQQALARDPMHAEALIGLVQGIFESDPQRSLQYLERLWSSHPTHRLWAARMALQELETLRDDREFPEQALKTWRERRREAENAEAEVMQELHRSAVLEAALPHDLSAFELEELRAELQRVQPVRQAWLVRKVIAAMPDRRAYVLLVSLTRAEDAAKRQLCAELEQRIDLQAMVLVLPFEAAATPEQLARVAGEPVFVRTI